MYEHRKQPLAKPSVFIKRLMLNAAIGLFLLIFSLGVGMVATIFLKV